jgi:peroxiredoxin
MKSTCVTISIFFSFLISAQNAKETDSLNILAKQYLDSLSKRPKTLIDKEIPPFKAYSSDGKFYSNDNLKNKITMINFWFEACAPCVAEMGALNNLFSNFKSEKNFQFFSFTFESKQNIERIRKKYDIQYPIISISNDSCYLVNFNSGFPTTIISNRSGKVAYYNCGGPLDAKSAQDSIIKNIYPVIQGLLQPALKQHN